MRRRLFAAASILLAAATVVRLARGGAPYFERPVTIVDHVGPREHEIRSALRTLPRLAAQIPPGARVAVVPDDVPHYLAAIAMMPDQVIVHGKADYIVHIR